MSGMEPRPTIGKYLLQALKELGIRQVFGIPGDMVIGFFKMIENDEDFNLCTFSHEPGVGFAAIGSSRATHKPAVTCITYGAGGLNMVNSVACAYAEKTPLIVISGGPGQAEKQKDVFLHHVVKDFDSQLKVYREVTQAAEVLDSSETAYTKIKRTLSACQEFMRPVYIEIPRDMVDQEIIIPKDNHGIFYSTDQSALKEAANEILLRTTNSKMPVILVGVEVDRLYLKNHILQLAKKLNIPVVSEFLARDIMPVDDPYYFGTYLGLAGNQVAKKLVEESDCLLMFGVIIADINLGIKLEKLKRENLILCFSRQVLIGHHVYNDVPLKPLIDELLQSEVDRKTFSFPAKIVPAINRTCKYIYRSITMNEVIDAINWFFSEYGEMPIISDTGDCLFITTKIQTSTIIASAYYMPCCSLLCLISSSFDVVFAPHIWQFDSCLSTTWSISLSCDSNSAPQPGHFVIGKQVISNCFLLGLVLNYVIDFIVIKGVIITCQQQIFVYFMFNMTVFGLSGWTAHSHKASKMRYVSGVEIFGKR